jgi:putative chitinase
MDFAASIEAVCAVLGPECPPEKVRVNLPLVIAALEKQGILTDECAIAAIATIAAETGNFSPVKERGGPTYLGNLYDSRTDLGNQGPPDGANFRGRGFVQITGRFNYTSYGKLLGIDLMNDPDLALDPANAAAILAAFFHQRGIAQFAAAGNWEMVRRRVNGGLNNWARFIGIVNGLMALIPSPTAQAVSAAAGGRTI